MANPLVSDILSRLVYPTALTAFNTYYLNGQISEVKQELKTDIRELKRDIQDVNRDLKGGMQDIKGDVRCLEDQQIDSKHRHAAVVSQ